MERLNMLAKRTAAALLLAGLLLPMPSVAGPLEDARALLAAGKPGEVDAALGKLLDRRPVASDVLIVSFQAAMADGRPYTAERRISALLEKGGAVDPKLIYQAAVVAGQLGKTSLRRERLLFFLRQEKGWNADVEAALLALCLDSGDADHYVRYLSSAPATEANLDLGLRMLAQMRTSKRISDYTKQLNILLSKYTSPAQRNRILVDASAMVNENVAGLQTAIFEVLARYPLHDDPVFLDMISRRGEWGVAQTIDYCSRNKMLLPAPVFGRIRQFDTINSPAERKELGQKLAQLESLCLASNRVDHLRAFFETIIRAPDVFLEGKPPRYDSAKLATLFATLVRNDWNRVDKLRALGSECISRKIWNEANAATMLKTYPNAFEARALVWPTLAEQARKTKDLGPTRELFKATGNRADIRWMALGYISELGDSGLVKEIVTEHVLSRPMDFDAENVARHLLGCGAMGVGDRVNTLKGLFAKTGYTPAWKRLVEWGQNPLKDDDTFKAFAKTVAEGAKSGDPLIAECVAMHALKRGDNNSVPPEAHAIAARAIKLYNGKYPDAKREQASEVFGAIWRKYFDLVQHSRPDAGQFVVQMTPAAGTDANWGQLFHLARHSQNITNFITMGTAYARLFPERADEVREMIYPLGTSQATLTPYYGIMTPDSAAHHVASNCERWAMPARLRELTALHKAQDFSRLTPKAFCRLLQAWQQLAPTNAFQAQIPFDDLAALVFDKRAGDDAVRLDLLRVYAQAGKLEAGLTRYLAAARKLDPVSRANEAISLMNATLDGRTPLIVLEPEGEVPTAVQFGTLMRGELLPALKAVPHKNSAALQPLTGSWLLDARAALAGRQKQEQEKEFREVAQAVGREIVLLVADGMPVRTDYWRLHTMARDAFAAALAASGRVDLVKIARVYGASHVHHIDNQGGQLLRQLEAAKEAGCWEPMHIAAGAVPSSDGAFAASLTRLSAEAATHMPGIYPVPENDPTYPLYVAADELERNNSERAWALLRGALGPFEREAIKLPPDFVIWGVEQLRRARGPKDSLLLKARAIADQLLAREASLTPELAASMLLTRAECFRDQRNFEAARLEYQTLRNNPSYRKTRAARRAMFRDVDLLIEIGNATAAEAIIEYWLSQPDVEVQAQAHYFLARISFDRKDYEETRKQLDNVFTLDFTHTEARLLHGSWKLATNYEVDDTAVLVGDLSDRTIIRPGQPLTITVQDRNLGVAGGGSSIPVTVRTSKGKDIERVSLYPSPRDPYLFRGMIDTQLGLATATNRVLELRGEETVSYEIEPGFLKLRGLETTPPKELRVVDDARLAIGAGAPQAESGGAEAELERLLLSTSTEPTRGYSDLANSLRPGNPLYVVVRDRDRSTTPEADAVYVEAKTTSGDTLERFKLTETGPFTGIFRGEIPTALPPPRASASDTATGFNVGDTINSTRDGIWRSVPDSQPGKWIEVDTMGSHSISNVALMMPDPAAVRSIRLTGRLADETIILGSLPVADASSRYGLRFQAAEGRKMNHESAIRTFFAGSKAPTGKAVTNLVFTPVRHNRDVHQNALISGAFVLPDDMRQLRLRIRAADTKGRTLAGLWMAIALDGVTVFTGQGNTLHRRVITLDVEPGPHRIEVFVSANFPEDAFEILHEPLGERATPFPIAWCDPEKAPALVDFLKDSAVITRDDKGFTATMADPVRLRSLRWEFLDYTGRELSVHKIYVQDAAGKLILPVKSDYSDALSNDTLEVAPGDRISVSYLDENTSSGEKRVLHRTMGSSFNDARVNFFFEELRETRYGNEMNLHAAYRFLPGDNLIVSVLDPDADFTAEADRVKVRVTTRSGHSRTLELIEQTRRFHNFHVPGAGGPDTEGVHGGHFLGLLRTVPADTPDAPANALPIVKGDVITMSYFDRENTRPGVPVERTAQVQAAQPSEPQLTLFHATVEREEDTSQDAKLRLAQIRRRPGNEHVVRLYREQKIAVPMDQQIMTELGSVSNPIPVNVTIPVPVQVTDASRARHSASRIMIEVAAASELEEAAAAERDPEVVEVPLTLATGFPEFRAVMPGGRQDPGTAGNFVGLIRLRLGPPDPSAEVDEDAPPELSVNGNDTVRLRVIGEKGKPVIERWMKMVSTAHLSLMDSTYSAERLAAHVGERFFVMVDDPDRDTGSDLDTVEVEVTAMAQGHTRRLRLRETLPHSGRFTGTLRPVIFGPGEAIPSVATGGVAQAGEELDDRLAVKYGDRVRFRYLDEVTLPGDKPGVIEVTGQVHKGSDGRVRLFSKRFRDSDMAVLVQFRLAECLFEMAKEHRRLKQPERSAEAIAEGKFILEEALRNYPGTSHIVEGEYLLANLYQELAMEQRTAKNMDAAVPLFTEALSRFSAILSTWPDSKFGARSQYHKALCLEMLGDYNRASEEYVKMTYLYPESPLVGDASIRLATYYYTQEKRYDTAGRIYSSFQKRFPTHEKAAPALFMSAQCHMKQAERLMEDHKKSGEKGPGPVGLATEEYLAAVEALDTLTEKYRDSASTGLRAQALYWAGDASLRAKVYDRAYLYLKRTVFEYPETEWARRARGLLLQEAKTFERLE
jgi:TolA-binding protein